jgi:cytochrome c peroxidase
MSRSYKSKYKKIIHRAGDGKFRQTTLRDFGFSDRDISDGSTLRCAACHNGQRAILKQWVCHQCGHENGVDL